MEVKDKMESSGKPYRTQVSEFPERLDLVLKGGDAYGCAQVSGGRNEF